MDNMQNVFGAETEAPVTAEQNAAKKQKIAVIKEAMKATLSTDATYQERLHKWSGSIKVVNTLGYGKNGNIVVDKAAKTDSRTLKATSKIVGYKIQNIGSEAIEYTTEVFAPDETGKFVGTIVKKTIAPGEQVQLTRQYMTMFCAQPEISFTLANGKIVSSSKKSAKNLKEELSAYYFSFNKDESGNSLQVNDDEVKLSVDDADGKVKPEYVETFGYLNNPKEGKAARAKKPEYTTQDLAANYIHKLLEEQGI